MELGMLDFLGLTEECEAVYRAMLADPGGGVAELVDHLGLPEPAVRAALDRLSALALLRPATDLASGLRAISPEVGLEVLLTQQQAELAAHTQRIEHSRAAAARLIAEFASLRPTTTPSYVEHLIGLEAIRDRLAELAAIAESEVMTFAPDGSHSSAAIAAARPLDVQLLERGVAIRTIYLDAVRNDQLTSEYLTWLTEQGAAVRTTASLPVRMIIINREVVVIPVDADRTGQGAIVLNGRERGLSSGAGTVTALCALFDTVWAQARPLGQEKARDEHGFTAQESEALRLLAQGHTDATIARRLGVSPRTARRIAAELMNKLGARSRFQAGVHAVQDNLLPGTR